MKICSGMLCILLMAIVSAPLFAETYYVRPDGGTRYSKGSPSGQCDGKADAPYRGKGENQHCAFKDYRYLWDAHVYGKLEWAISGGDTVIIRGGPWRVGFDTATGKNEPWCFGGDGPYSCSNPPIPAGTAAQHTRILGENYGHCNKNNMTQLFGGHGVYEVMNLGGAQYVDVECIELTRHSQCVTHGSPAYPAGCNTSLPLDDYDSSGISTNVKTHDVLLQDMWIHGHTDRGIKGPIGGVVTATRVDIAYNGMAGWDFDDGNSTSSVSGVWNFNQSTIEFSGCNQEYPATHPFPAISCYGQSNGGYGDGVGTPAGMCLTANINQSVFRYNTQDGLDLGHIDTGKCSLSITNSIAYGNNGGQFKWGPNENPAIFVNNLVLANCLRMSAPLAGAPSTYNTHLGDFCRAEDGIAFNFRQGGTALIANNTIVTYAPTTFDIGCWDNSCSDATVTYKNNLVLGYDNPATYSFGGKPGGPAGYYYQKTIGHIVRANNLYYGLRGMRWTVALGSERFDDPKLVSQPRFAHEQDLDNFDFHPSDSSPARGAGVRIPEIRTDYDGKPRPAAGNYDIGAYQH